MNLGNPAPLQRTDQRRLYLSAQHRFRLVETNDAERGPYKVETVGYWYAFDAKSDGRDEMMSFHWDPELPEGEGPTEPHLHLKPMMISQDAPLAQKTFGKLHIPTGRVSLESVVRFAIAELGVEPRVAAWDMVLCRNEGAYRTYRNRG